jgi:hypothetical protein
MSDLIVIGYPDEAAAENVWRELIKLQNGYLVDLDDAAIIRRDSKGKLHVTTPAHHPVAWGTLSGMFWGVLLGLLFLFPLAPLAGVAGGIMGAALGGRRGYRDQGRLQATRAGPGAAGDLRHPRHRPQGHPGQVPGGAAAVRRDGPADLAAARRGDAAHAGTARG